MVTDPQGYQSSWLQVPIVTDGCLSANRIAVSMVTGCTGANLKRVYGPCTSCFLHWNDQPSVCPEAISATKQVLLGAQVTQVNIDVGTLCTSVMEGGMDRGKDEKNQSSSLFFFSFAC